MRELFDSPSFEDQRKAWSNPPVDDVGYLSSKELLALEDDELLALVAQMEKTRYAGWRNWNGHWRDVLGLDSTVAKSVLDYGCGVGLESLQYAKRSNYVSIADICEDNVRLAHRVLRLHGYRTLHEMIIEERPPFLPWLRPTEKPGDSFDVIHCCGVLHHIPNAREVVEAMHSWLREEGELRLMVYSDEAWKLATGTEPPEGDVSGYEEFETFVRYWDGVGDWADWYDKTKLMDLAGDLFTLNRFRPLTSDKAYVGAVLTKR